MEQEENTKRSSGFLIGFRNAMKSFHTWLSTAEDRKNIRRKKFRESGFGRWLDSCFFKQVEVDLSDAQDGSLIRSIRKPRWTKTILIVSAVLLVIIVSFIPFDYTHDVVFNWSAFGRYFRDMFTPSPLRTKNAAGWWSFSWESFAIGIHSPLINSAPFFQIFEICFIGTSIGAICAIPVYYSCAHNVNHNHFTRVSIKVFNDFLRCIPMFILCVMLCLVMGVGNTLPAILAVAIFSLGIMYQMMYEYLETLNMRPFESVKSSGANNLQSVLLGLHPEVKPMFFAYSIYTLEINIRASVVLSYVGISSTYMNALQIFIENHWYDYVGAMLVPLFLIVATLQIVSNTLVRKIR